MIGVIFGAVCLVVFGAIVGVVFGGLEGDAVEKRLAAGNEQKLPHGKLLAARMLVCGLVAVMTMGYSVDTLYAFGILMVSLTMAHRMSFNNSIGKPFWYMGPEERSEGDSIYDNIAWGMSAGITDLFGRDRSPVDPFAFIMILEVAVLSFLIVMFVHP